MEGVLFLLYRKFLKSSEIVYNGLEIKNDITKERRGLRHDVVYEVFCFGLGEYYGTAEPPVRCGESHLSGLTEPLHFVY